MSIEAVRRRLGHASTETTLLYAMLDDKVADAEIRAAAGGGTTQPADRVLSAAPSELQREEFSMMSCASCEQAIPPAEAGLPCPRCGSVDRNVATADYGAAVNEVTGLDARFPPAPAPWQQMWAEVRHHLDIVRGWYSGGQGMNVTELSAASVAFFVSCYHLAEHIRADPAAPQSARAQVRGYANSNSSLKLAADITNTYKHSERHPGERACSITDASTRPTWTCWMRPRRSSPPRWSTGTPRPRRSPRPGPAKTPVTAGQACRPGCAGEPRASRPVPRRG